MEKNYVGFCMNMDFENIVFSRLDFLDFKEKIIKIEYLLCEYGFKRTTTTEERNPSPGLNAIMVSGIKEGHQDIGEFNRLVLEVGGIVKSAKLFKTEGEVLKKFTLRVSNDLNYDCIEVDLLGDVLSQLQKVKKILI